MNGKEPFFLASFVLAVRVDFRVFIHFHSLGFPKSERKKNQNRDTRVYVLSIYAEYKTANIYEIHKHMLETKLTTA